METVSSLVPSVGRSFSQSGSSQLSGDTAWNYVPPKLTEEVGTLASGHKESGRDEDDGGADNFIADGDGDFMVTMNSTDEDTAHRSGNNEGKECGHFDLDDTNIPDTHDVVTGTKRLPEISSFIAPQKKMKKTD